MRIWGKIIGSVCGYLLMGPFGLIIGFIVGHVFDKGFQLQRSFFFGGATQTREAFFNATFSVMGYIAKADGRVSEREIQAVRGVMNRMNLNEEQRKNAINLFEQGKQPDFNLDQTLTNLMQVCHSNKILLQMFVELQMQTALAEGHLSAEKQRILQQISQRLGFVPLQFAFFDNIFRGAQGSYQQYQQYQHSARPSSGIQLQEAYKVLEINSQATDIEVKKAYRKMMSQHHPDKLIAKGLPEEMVKLATEKTQQIQGAYEKICTARGIK